jgi:hypothetical protein
MKKLTLLFVLALITKAIVYSQPCLPEGITFTTQEQIDSFQVNYPDCTEIEGNVEIGSYPPNSSITNLDGLSEITYIHGQFSIIHNELLSDFSGLDSLKYCFDLQMVGNNSIVNLNGFNSLDSISFILSICNFDSLEMISGFNSLGNIPDNIFINNNPNLQKIVGLNFLSSAGPLYLNNNNSLTDLSGFSNLSSLYCLYLSNCNSLNDLSGFSQLDSIPADFVIYQCNSITDFSSIQNLNFIGGEINIYGNTQLESLAGLDSVDITTIYDLHIMNNPSLSECAVQSICKLLDSSSISVHIENNYSGCNSIAEVEEACITNIDYYNINSSLSIYPNPANKKLFVLNDSNQIFEEINIYNQIGQKVLNIDRVIKTIDISTLCQGLYIVELVSSENKIRKKLIIN